MEPLVKAHLDHRRTWLDFDYCYPVISRRSKGLSLGVDLNPDKVCNFDCVYCEVDRTNPGRRSDVDLDQLEREMATLIDLAQSGEIYSFAPFNSARPDQQRLNDIAFSGNGEPTTAKGFSNVVEHVARLKVNRGLSDVKLVLITDSSRLQAPDVVQGLETLMAHQGEIWVKLDAGTEAYYREINRSKVPFTRILENLLRTARRWPITLQTLFLEWKGQGPSEGEVHAYTSLLQALQEDGAKFQGLQLYTVARPTPEAEARPLNGLALNQLADQVRAALPGLPIEVFYGPDGGVHA